MRKKLKVLLLSTMLTVGVVGCSKNENVSTEKENDWCVGYSKYK